MCIEYENDLGSSLELLRDYIQWQRAKRRAFLDFFYKKITVYGKTLNNFFTKILFKMAELQMFSDSTFF